MSTFCKNCGNFFTIIELNGIPYNKCRICMSEEPHEGVSIISTFNGALQTVGEVSTDAYLLENLTYETSMAISKDVKCKKCKGDTIYIIDATTDRYRYGCVKCHKEVT